MEINRHSVFFSFVFIDSSSTSNEKHKKSSKNVSLKRSTSLMKNRIKIDFYLRVRRRHSKIVKVKMIFNQMKMIEIILT